MIPIADLRDHPRNSNRHGEHQLAVLEQRFRALGWYKNVVVAEWEGTTTLLAGHGVTRGAERAGETVAPCHVREIDPLSAEALDILEGDNTVADLAEPDLRERLRNLVELDAAGRLGNVGFDDGALDRLKAELQAEDFAATQGPPVEDPGPSEPPAEPVSKLGDVWLCGQHRIVCGDSTEVHVAAKLFGDKRARMVWTDPPYGVSYADKNEFLNSLDNGHRIQEPIAHDHMSEVDTEALVRDALTLMAAHGVPGAVCYVACPPGPLLPHFIAAVNASGFGYRHHLAWVKQQFVLGRCDYHYRHEVILYGWKPDGAHYFVDDHTHDSVFEVDKPHRSEDHPTMKPLELVAQMVANSSKPGDIVADPFLGSGTTLVAAEQLGRVCYGIEIEHRYVDVAVRRWQQATHQTAILESTGEPFPVVE
jgi:DNA modification methylase